MNNNFLDIQSFVEQLISVPNIECNPLVQIDELVQYIVTCIRSSRFRKSKLDQHTLELIRANVIAAVKSKKPIKFSVPFGAYKGWKLPTHPETDWAEVFNIRHMINYMLPIAQVYQEGVIIYYTYQDDIMHKISNLPKSHFEQYKKCFSELLNYYNTKLFNIKFELFPINRLYSSHEAYISDFQKEFEYNIQHWTQKYSRAEREKKTRSARNNLARKGSTDYSALSEEEWEEKCIISAMQTDAVDCLYWRRKFNKRSDKIQLVFVRGPENSVHIGSCLTSTAHFWAGTGVLEFNKKLLPRILTQHQYLTLASADQLDRFNINNIFSEISKNYSYIELIK